MRNSKLFLESCKKELRENKRSFIVYVILRASIIVLMIRNIIAGRYETSFVCILALILMFIPSFVQASFHIDISEKLEIIIYLFIYAAEILGEIHAFYIIFPFWDNLLHVINGFVVAAIGYSLATLLNNSEKIEVKLSPFFLAFVAFCFSMTIGVIWEFIEWTIDFIFKTDMQKDTLVNYINTVFTDPTNHNNVQKIPDIASTIIQGKNEQIIIENGYLDIGLYDTMQDLFVNFIGALIFSISGYISIKKGKKSTNYGLKITKQNTDKTPKS